ncbi:hypothetical protein Trydic_g12990 [Trypoxylus dichotomus]
MGSVKRLTKNGRGAPESDDESNSDSSLVSTKSLVATVTKTNALEDAKGRFDASKTKSGDIEGPAASTDSSTTSLEIEDMDTQSTSSPRQSPSPRETLQNLPLSPEGVTRRERPSTSWCD